MFLGQYLIPVDELAAEGYQLCAVGRQVRKVSCGWWGSKVACAT